MHSKLSSIVVLCILLAISCSSAQAVDGLYFTSTPGSWIGQGQTLTFDTVGTYRYHDQGAYTNAVTLSAGGYALTLVEPNYTVPTVGHFDNVTRWPFMGSGAGMDFNAPGRGNNTLTGWFTVYQADYNPDGSILAFAVDFRQYEEGSPTTWTQGSIRYNSWVGLHEDPTEILAINHSACGSVTDLGINGTADTVSETPFIDHVTIPTGILRDTRGVVEFNCAGIDPDLILSARIDGTMYVNNWNNTGVRNIGVRAFSGDGTVGLDDYDASAASVGVIPFAATGPQSFQFDVTDEIKTILADGCDYFGTRFDPLNEQAPSVLGDDPGEYVLTITMVPEPATGLLLSLGLITLCTRKNSSVQSLRRKCPPAGRQ